MLPLKNSNAEKTKEKSKIKEILFLQNGPVNKIAKPKNNDKNKGINTSANGIKLTNNSSWVNDMDIQ